MKVAAILFLIMVGTATPAAATRYMQRAIANDHLQWSCDTVRWWHEHRTEDQLRAMAKAAGITLSPRQQAEAAACLK